MGKASSSEEYFSLHHPMLTLQCWIPGNKQRRLIRLSRQRTMWAKRLVSRFGFWVIPSGI